MQARYMVSVTDVFYERLKAEAEKAGMNISEYTRYCINRYWDEKSKEERKCF